MSTLLEGVESIFHWRKRYNDYIDNMSAYLFNLGDPVVETERTCSLDDKSSNEAHHYTLVHLDDMEQLID